MWAFIKKILFRMNAEFAHHFSMRCLIILNFVAPALVRRLGVGSHSSFSQPRKIFGLNFKHAIGLAAGFDKDASYLPVLANLGFSFVEIGTVTPRAQAGNDKPRLFRIQETKSLFNRMGFNNKGAKVVAANLKKAKKRLPEDFIIGVNVGKNKSTENENAARDYQLAVREFAGLADYVVVNVSSPNTPGLRDLQSAESMRRILEAVNEELSTWDHRVPLLVKLAPELDKETLQSLLDVFVSQNVAGLVLCNTLKSTYRQQNGGMSGACLTTRSEEMLGTMKTLTTLPIISVGGVMNAQHVAMRLELGASLVQVYTGWIYGGPGFLN